MIWDITMDKRITSPRLDERLCCAVEMVRDGGVAADIGTDHAYVPIELLKSGRISRAVATDVNIGPLERAKVNAARYGVVDKIRFILADGLNGIEPEREPVTDIVVCGMGGELIAKIIDGSDYTRSQGVHLILQPMTCAYELRKYLAESGFKIEREKLCKAAGKIYTCILAEYDGLRREPTDAELTLGARNIEKGGALFCEYAMEHAKKLRVRIDGLGKGGLNHESESACLREIEKILHELHYNESRSEICRE